MMLIINSPLYSAFCLSSPLLKTRDWEAISKAIRTKRGALLVLYRYFPIFVTNQNTKDNEKY
jgi:hypothetical protein